MSSEEGELRFLTDSCRIAISGLSGCGNTTVGKLLSKRLRIPFINYTFRSMARERNCSLEELAALAAIDYNIDKQIDARQRQMAQQWSFCVVSSRLAIWFIENADIKLYLLVDDNLRYERIRQREKKPLEQVVLETVKRDAADIHRYKEIYGIDIMQYRSCADRIISNNISSEHEVIENILVILVDAGYIAR